MDKPQIRIGTSGWEYRHWRINFYPKDVATCEWLRFYAERFPCVEVKNSFYRLPEPATIAGWCEQTPEDFVFAVKTPRVITHFKKLRNCEVQLQTFFSRLYAFGERLGPILFQLPPRWHCNPQRLEDFLNLLPLGRRYVFEFRDPSWHCDETYQLLEGHKAAFCIFDLDGVIAPLWTTAEFTYVRLHGPEAAYTGSYPAHTLRGWSGRALGWNRKGQDVYMFFDNDQDGFAAKNAHLTLSFLSEGMVDPGEAVSGAGP